MVIVFGAVVRAMFSTGRALAWVDQSFMSHQEVTARVII